MIKRKSSVLLAFLLVFMQCLIGTGSLVPAVAATISSNIIDSVTLSVYDEAGHVVTGDVYEQGSKVQLDYSWSLPNGHGYRNQDEFTFALPDQFLLFNDISGILANDDLDDDQVVGTFHVDAAAHQVRMTFNDFIENHDDVHGTLTLNTQFDKQKITGSTTQVIKIPVKSGEQVVTVRFKPNVSSTVSKSGIPDGFNAKNIDWTIDVNKALESVQDATVTDPIPTGLSVPVSVAVYDLDVNLDGTVVQRSPVDAGKYTVSVTGNILKISFTDNPLQHAYRIQYTTAVADTNQASFVNTATFSGSNMTPVSAKATVAVQYGSPLKKASTGYDSSTQTLSWEIKYNYGEKTISQAEAFLTDLFDDSQQLVANSIHVYPVALNSSGAETLGGEIPASEYSVIPATAAGKNGFKIQFNQSISSAYKMIYQTKAIDRVLDNATITNQVSSGDGSSHTATRNVNQVVMVKTPGAADYKARTVTWSIVLNGDSQPMSGAVVTDTFPHKGLRFLPDSLVVQKGGAALDQPADFSLDNTISADDGFKLTIHNAFSEPITISYKTIFNPEWLSPAGSTLNYDNSAVLDWVDEFSNAHTKTITSTFVPRSEVKNNGFKYGSYDAVSKQITWTIGVNYNSNNIMAGRVEDALGSNQTLVDHSLAVYDMTIPPNGNAAKGAVVDPSSYSYAVGNDGKLIVTFNNPISAPYYVIFNTSLEGKLIDSSISNTAQLFDGSEQVSQNLTAAVNIPNGGEYVNKSGTQTGDKINWTIQINRSQSTVADAKLIDTPTDNQLFLPDTFHLYATQVSANGEIVKGLELTKDIDYTLVFDTDADGKQSFVLSFKNPINTAYILDYQSLIVADDQDTVSNKASFSGNNVITVEKETTKDILVGVSTGSGTGGGVRGSLTVKKVDSADSTILLSGATFELYRKSGSDLLSIGTASTDASGTAVFNKLLKGDYVVRETVAPAGYKLDAKDYPVTIDSTAGITFRVANTKSDTSTSTPTPSPTPTITPTPTPKPGHHSSSGSSPTPSPTPGTTSTPTPSAAPTPSTAPTPSPSALPTPTPNTSPSPSPSAAPTPNPPREQQTTNPDTPFEGHIDVPLGGIPIIRNQPENGEVTIDSNGNWTYKPNPGFTGKDEFTIVVQDKDGKETETYVEMNVQVPLGGNRVTPVQTLPKTGESSHMYVELAGLTFILAGILLRRRMSKGR